jgi:hypothetical protein
MKIKFTFEYADLLEQIEKMLAMNGVKALTNDKGQKRITFNSKKKEVTVEAEAAPIPEACLFCGAGVNQEAQTIDDSKTQAISTETSTTNDEEQSDETSQANTGEEQENVPMSMAALRAQSGALATQDGPIKHDVQRGAEAHAELVKPSRLDGESEDPPFPGEGGA